MTRISITTLLGSSLLVLALGIPALATPQRYVFHDFKNPSTLFSQTRSDLDAAQRHAFPRDTDPFVRARAELSDLEQHWDEHTYDPRQAEDVVVALQRVLDAYLLPRDRGRLDDDLRKMRLFVDEHR
jgi:hypothetical protein